MIETRQQQRARRAQERQVRLHLRRRRRQQQRRRREVLEILQQDPEWVPLHLPLQHRRNRHQRQVSDYYVRYCRVCNIYWQRDVNAARNIRDVYEHLCEHQTTEHPFPFRRGNAPAAL